MSYHCLCGRLIEAPPPNTEGLCSMICASFWRAQRAVTAALLAPGPTPIFAMHPVSWAYLTAGPSVTIERPATSRASAQVRGLEVEQDPRVEEGVVELRVSVRALR